jgi:sterol desaturase/sphingolipid hydroxylase (fatty acid hydroxylase superfamily)
MINLLLLSVRRTKVSHQKQTLSIMETMKLFIPPILIGSIIVEAYLSAKENLEHYERKDTITNVTIASLSVLLNLLIKGFIYGVYSLIHQKAIFQFEAGVISWIILFVLTDLQFYLFHLLGHKSRFFWAMHVIHHSSDKYNLSTAIRTPLTNSCFRFASLSTFIFLGFSPLMVLTMDSIILTYAFFQHTEFIKKLGWLEYIFNTPSHHRVHHASDEKYLDKNFGGILIIWDKLFGTFKEEAEHPVYGITKPLTKPNSILHVLTHEWVEIYRDIKKHPIGLNSLRIIFMGPSWTGASQNKNVRNIRIQPYTKLALLVSVLIMAPLNSEAQDSHQLIKMGIDAETNQSDDAAIKYYCLAMRKDPRSIEALTRASWALNRQAGRAQNKYTMFVKADSARQLASRALRYDRNETDSRLAFIVSLGLISKASKNPSEKLRNAMLIRKEAELLLLNDSLCGPANYILAKWHYELAKLTWLERVACKTLIEFPKDVSYERSLYYYEKAIQLKPDYILFHYGKAATLYQKGEFTTAVNVLENAIKLPAVEPDDKERKAQCLSLLTESKKFIQ